MIQETIQAATTADLLAELDRRVASYRCSLTPMCRESIIILQATAQTTGVNESLLLGTDTKDYIASARHIAMTLIVCAGFPYATVGRIFTRHHTTVMNARKRFTERYELEPAFKTTVLRTLAIIRERDSLLEITPPHELKPDRKPAAALTA